MLETLPLHHLARVISLLTRGQVVAYPTGTVYGLGVNALNHAALARLSELKGRPAEKTYSLLLPSRDPDRYVRWTAEERRVYEALRDRPLTLLLEAQDPLRHLARDGRVGIRTPDHPFTRELVTLLPFPITATSANVSDQPPACAIDELAVFAPFGLLAVDGGRLLRCLPSTVAAKAPEGWTIIRAGEVTATELAAAADAPLPSPARAPARPPRTEKEAGALRGVRPPSAPETP